MRLAALLISLLAAFPARAEVRAPYDTEKLPGAPPAPATAGIALPDGFAVDLVAREPDVRQPIHMTFDERGRLWVVENYTFAERPVRFARDLRDRVVIFDDRDGDGRFETRKVFWSDGQRVTSVAMGFGGVWVTAAPRLLFIPDADRDDVPDGPPQTVLDGFDDDVIHHNIVNGLAWGPDGWLYGRHGIQAVSRVGAPGTPASARVAVGVGVWRFHPVHRTVEMVARGTTNPWGLDWDDHGQAFFINTVIGHLWHVVPGARYQRMYGDDADADTFRLMEQTADHVHWNTTEPWTAIRKIGVSDATSRAGGGHAHSGFMIYLGDSWPAQYRGGAFTLNFHGRRINHDHLARKGAGFVATHGADLMKIPDPWFRGVDLLYGPDGDVYVADWSDTGECHENSGVHRSSGRIYRLRHGPHRPAPRRDLAALPDTDLVALQLHPNDWYVRQARRLLHQRAAAGQDLSAAHRALRAMFDAEADARRKLRALWALHLTGGAPRPWLASLAAHADEHVRLWAVRLATDAPSAPDAGTERVLVQRARRERSPLVRAFVASALQRIPVARRGPLIDALASGAAEDANLSLLLWYGAGPWVAANERAAARLAVKTPQPLLRELIARRLAQRLEHDPRALDALLAGVLPRPAAQVDVLRGIAAGLDGWKQAPRPRSWAALGRRVSADAPPELRRLVTELGVVFGDPGATAALRTLAASPQATPAARRSAVRALVDRGAAEAAWLLERIEDPVTAAAAIRGLASQELARTPQVILAAWPRLDPEARQAAIATLVSRAAYAHPLLDAIAARDIPRAALSAFHARQLSALGDAALDRRLAEIWGDLRATSAEKQETIRALEVALAPARLRAADATRGKAVFGKVCAACHKLNGEGGAVGPDLTGADRGDLGYLLHNIVDPSAVVAADWRASAVHLGDGRVLHGFVGPRGGKTLTVRGIGEPITVERSTVTRIETTDASLMPDGLLEPLTPEEVRDLFAYLMSR